MSEVLTLPSCLSPIFLLLKLFNYAHDQLSQGSIYMLLAPGHANPKYCYKLEYDWTLKISIQVMLLVLLRLTEWYLTKAIISGSTLRLRGTLKLSMGNFCSIRYTIASKLHVPRAAPDGRSSGKGRVGFDLTGAIPTGCSIPYGACLLLSLPMLVTGSLLGSLPGPYSYCATLFVRLLNRTLSY